MIVITINLMITSNFERTIFIQLWAIVLFAGIGTNTHHDFPPGNLCHKYGKSMEHFILPTDFPSFLS